MPKSSGDVMVKDQTKLLHLYCSKKHRNVEKVHQPNKTIKKYSPKLLCWPLSAVAGLPFSQRVATSQLDYAVGP